MKKIITLGTVWIASFVFILTVRPEQIRTLSVQFAGRGNNPKGGEDPKPATFSGAAVVGQKADQWNVVNAEAGNPLQLGPLQNLRASDGQVTTVFLATHGFTGADYFPPDQGAPRENALLNAYVVASGEAGVTIGGLVPRQKYDLYLFGSNSRAGAGAAFSVNGSSKKKTRASNEGEIFSEEVDYVGFKEVPANGHGELQVTVAPHNFEGAIFNGFQLVGNLSPLTERSQLPNQKRFAGAKFEGIADERGQYFDEPVVSFVYGGKKSDELLPQWKLERASHSLDAQRIERVVTWTDPDTQLQVRCVGIEYLDFPVIEWTPYFKNGGQKDSPILENIQAIDSRLVRGQEGEFVLHYMPGSLMLRTDYQPFEATLGPGQEKTLATSGGRPCNAFMPFFNLAWTGGGAIVVVGWPGQWSASFTRDQGIGLQVRAGQELTHFQLHPGEEVRGPLMALLFYKGDWIDGQNVWRRWMVAHNVPRENGEPAKPTWKACSSHQFAEMIKANEENQKLFIDRYLKEGLKLDYWWMDAGWYLNDGTWVNTGTWEVDRKRFPGGLRAISDYAAAQGVKTLVWFEPERVTKGSWLYEKHPEWLLAPDNLPKGLGYQKVWRLLDLGNLEARTWLIDHVDEVLKNEGIHLYRQDFNMDPVYFWRANDTPERQGIREIGHVTGYLAYWDALRRRHPGMYIDSCASGGRRNDLETLRRAIPYVRDDYLFEPNVQQCHTYGLALWLPEQGTGVMDRRTMTNSTIFKPAWLPKDGARPIESDSYLFRSVMMPHLTACYDMRDQKVDYATLRKLYEQWRLMAENYYGDYYPITPYSLADDVWMAWQFDRPDAGAGMVQAFRRPGSWFEAARFKLRGLQPGARYKVTDLDAPDREEVLTGRQLAEQGLLVTIKEQPGAVVVAYKKAE